ncbi:MAG: hypothetical protein DMD25_00035 [Gemmatimonadetes bacterium]|nr:MAG: hypothetical protein DMD57_12745 [Gemmatimonadota bacterium]PYP02056.1 MAG: hypothetical protein DMD27_16205 [Gemmatimonadota bacterium]PYP82052.1 MAG: hypothetical protein DMD25_00035 [Gemmatimonadota bacterium]
MEARDVRADGDRLTGEAVGEIEEADDKVLVIRRIHVRLHLRASAEQRATAERTHGVFAKFCPVYRSLHKAIDITTELVFREA